LSSRVLAAGFTGTGEVKKGISMRPLPSDALYATLLAATGGALLMVPTSVDDRRSQGHSFGHTL
jgi:hypothetical protein